METAHAGTVPHLVTKGFRLPENNDRTLPLSVAGDCCLPRQASHPPTCLPPISPVFHFPHGYVFQFKKNSFYTDLQTFALLFPRTPLPGTGHSVGSQKLKLHKPGTHLVIGEEDPIPSSGPGFPSRFPSRKGYSPGCPSSWEEGETLIYY